MIILDEFLTDPDAASKDASDSGFRDYEYEDGVVYPDIAPGVDTQLRKEVIAKIQDICDFEIDIKEYFYRRSKKDVESPHWAHTDADVSEYVAIIYLTDPPPGVNAGTAILQHKSGWSGQPETPEQFRDWQRDTKNPDQWNIVEFAGMVKNRIVIHSAADLHAAMPIEGFGEGGDARLVLVVFFNQKRQFVRMARPSDIPELAELAMEFDHERGPRSLGISVNIPGFMASMNNFIVNDPMYGCFVAVHKGQVVGACAARIGPGAMDQRQLIAIEQFWFVTPDHRNTKLGIRLFDAVEKWAREVGADVLDFIALASSEDNVRKFYERRGFRELETHFVKELN
jgi:GNAT superfamily N-acetyltransferase